MFIPFFRRIRHVGRIRAWESSKVERRTWDDERYPSPPELRYPGVILILGDWNDIYPSAHRTKNRYSRVRGSLIESDKKIKRLKRRRAAQRYQAYHKRIGKW